MKIERHRDLQRRVLERAKKWPSWMLSYDIRKELKDAGITMKNTCDCPDVFNRGCQNKKDHH